jgi:hypothetical protein
MDFVKLLLVLVAWSQFGDAQSSVGPEDLVFDVLGSYSGLN